MGRIARMCKNKQVARSKNATPADIFFGIVRCHCHLGQDFMACEDPMSNDLLVLRKRMTNVQIDHNLGALQMLRARGLITDEQVKAEQRACTTMRTVNSRG